MCTRRCFRRSRAVTPSRARWSTASSSPASRSKSCARAWMPGRSSPRRPFRSTRTTRSRASRPESMRSNISCIRPRFGATSADPTGSKATASCSRPPRRRTVVERPALEAVLLDAGGTLGRLDFEWMAECVTALGHPVDAATLRSAELVGRRRYDLSAAVENAASPPLGAAGNIHDYFGGMLEAAGVPRELIDRAVDAFMTRQAGPGLWARRMEGALQALDGLRALGLRRAVVSNSDGRAEWHLREWGLLEHLEFVIDSHLVKVEKPNPKIFMMALDRLRIPAARD